MKVGFIVEGFHDEEKVKTILPHAYVVVTKGTRLNNRVRMDIQEVLRHSDCLFLLTDPDDAGEQLANMIITEFPTLKRILLEEKECICYRQNKRKVGVEHCSDDYLKRVFSSYF